MNDSSSSSSDRLKNLTENTTDILSTVRQVHGDRYHNVLFSLFCTASTLTQLDDMLCESTAVVRNMAAMQNNAELMHSASENHEIGHSLAHASSLGILGLIQLLETECGFRDLSKNFTALLHRIEVDFRNPHG